jgi:hypothetical protein
MAELELQPRKECNVDGIQGILSRFKSWAPVRPRQTPQLVALGVASQANPGKFIPVQRGSSGQPHTNTSQARSADWTLGSDRIKLMGFSIITTSTSMCVHAFLDECPSLVFCYLMIHPVLLCITARVQSTVILPCWHSSPFFPVNQPMRKDI